MDILFVTAGFIPQRTDGTVVTVWSLAQELHRLGLQVGIVCRELSSSCEKSERPHILDDVVDGLPVKRFFMTCERDFRTAYDHPEACGLFKQVLASWHPRLVHFHHIEHLSPRLPGWCSAVGVPTLMTLHDFHLVCPTVQLMGNRDRVCPGPDGGRRCSRCRPARCKVVHRLPWRNRQVRMNVYLDTLLRRDRNDFVDRWRTMRRLWSNDKITFISPSSYLARKMTRAMSRPRRIVVIRNGSTCRPHDPVINTEDGHLHIGYIGSLYRPKGLHVLTAALAHVLDLPAWHLQVHGDGDREYLGRCLSSLPERRFTYRGAFGLEQTQTIMEKMDLLVVPSVWPENCPLVVMQAAGAGVPSLVSGWGGLRELAEARLSSSVFRPISVHDLARRLRCWMSQPDLVLGARGLLAKQHVPQWSDVAKRHLEVYRRTGWRVPGRLVTVDSKVL